MSKTQTTVVGLVVAFLGTLILSMLMFDVYPVHGNEIAVLESYTGGINPEPYGPRTYFVLPWERMYSYNMGQQVYVMNDTPSTTEQNAEGRENGSFLVQSLDSQDMRIELNVQWHLNPAKVVEIHKTVRDHIEDRLIRPTLLRIVKDEATQVKAIDAYSGIGLVQLQQKIESDLTSKDSELAEKGVIVTGFVIEHIGLSSEYIGEIQKRQVAQQRKLRADEEEKAAQAEALKAKAEARKEYEIQVVNAERDKQVEVLKAEAQNQKEILSAEAQKQKTVLAAEARKESGELEAAAILAIGKATAEAEKLKFSAYSAEGADVYAKIEIAKAMSSGMAGVKGYLPSDMTIFTIGNEFNNAVEKILGQKKGDN